MTFEQKQLVQRVFAQVQPASDMLALLFYSRLFELDPALRALFPTDMAEQGHALFAMLQLSVVGLDAPEELTHALRNLGERHVGYGTCPEHYATVVDALLWTMQRGLGSSWTPEIAAALTVVFVDFTAVMQGKHVGHAP